MRESASFGLTLQNRPYFTPLQHLRFMALFTGYSLGMLWFALGVRIGAHLYFSGRVFPVHGVYHLSQHVFGSRKIGLLRRQGATHGQDGIDRG